MKKILLRKKKSKQGIRYGAATTSLIALLILTGCGGGGDGAEDEAAFTPSPDASTAPAPSPDRGTATLPEAGTGTPPAAEAADRLSCTELAGRTIAANATTMPTAGADITAASLVAPSAETTREYCRVTGAIHPAGQNGPDILFQLNLPTDWNRKALQFGNTGFGGTIVTGTGMVPYAPGELTPLSQGYVTFGSDTGHQGGDFTFALNDEALINFGGAHIKKTHDIALEIVRLFYAARPERMYYAGGSTGGREALTAIQRWPDDFDGVIASAPLQNFNGMRLNGIRIGQANYAPGGFLNQEKRRLVTQAGLNACDGLDNVRDGIVSNVAACKAQSGNTLALLRCADGTDQGNGCLSDQQIATVRTVDTDLILPYTLANGVNRYPGYNALTGTDMQIGSDPVLRDPPTVAANGSSFGTGAAWARFFMASDPNFDVMSFNPLNAARFTPRIQELSTIIGATDPDLSTYQASGGKVIMMHGLADSVASPNSTIDYYDQVVARLGQQQTDTFVRLYAVPGFNHDYGQFRMAWDALGALDNWVGSNTAPGTIIGTDLNAATAGRTRPLCVYPAYPLYVSGDVNAAGSFACTMP